MINVVRAWAYQYTHALPHYQWANSWWKVLQSRKRDTTHPSITTTVADPNSRTKGVTLPQNVEINISRNKRPHSYCETGYNKNGKSNELYTTETSMTRKTAPPGPEQPASTKDQYIRRTRRPGTKILNMPKLKVTKPNEQRTSKPRAAVKTHI